MTIKSITIISAISTVVGALAALYAARATAAEVNGDSNVTHTGSIDTSNGGGGVVIGNGSGNVTNNRTLQVTVLPQPRTTRLSRSSTLLATPDIAQFEKTGQTVCHAIAGTKVAILATAQTAYGIEVLQVAILDGDHAGSAGWVAAESVTR